MRILISNKFYYPRGGDCVYTINLQKLLEKNGHEVAVFAMQHAETIDTPYQKYFPAEVDFSNKKQFLKTIFRPFGTREVRRKFTQLLNDFQPEVLHLNNIHTQLSPVIAKIAHKRGIKVVWTLHDYKLLCPRYDCLKNDKEPCELCFQNKKFALKNRCMKNSLVGSIITYVEAKKWSRQKLEKYTDTFICPSQFAADKMISGGFDKNKIIKLHNFIDTEKIGHNHFEKENYYCYVGRISPEKGIKTLIKAASTLPYPLKIVGSGELYGKLKTETKNIEFLGLKNWSEIKEIVGKARFFVIPSEWYENNPLSVIESLCLGTPVLGANIGGIPELTQTNEMNMTFEMKNAVNLAEKINTMWQKTTGKDYSNLAKSSQEKFNSENYYHNLINIYKNEKNIK